MRTDVTTNQRSNADINCDGNGCTVSASAQGGFSTELKNAKGWAVSFGLSGELSSTHEVSTENGVTTYTAEAEVSVTLEGGVNTPYGGAEVARTDGINATYEVSMPEDVATPATMATANPFDPCTMPEGTVIRVDSSQYTTNEFSATFRGINVSNNITETEGSSMVMESLEGDVVRVTTGPTQGIDVYTGVGVDFEAASLSLGNNTSLDGSTFRTAEFDLSTAEGQAAYNHFLATGEMPTANGTGVANVQTIQTIDYSSQASVEGNVGPFDFSLEGGANTGNSVVITQPDGTATQTATFSYYDGVPITVTRQFDAQGQEVLSERTYSFEVEVTEGNYQLLNVMTSGDVNEAQSGPYQLGQTVTLTLTEEGMGNLQALAEQTVEENPRSGISALAYNT